MRREIRLRHARLGFGDFDFLQSETRARQLFYATDNWADRCEKDGVPESQSSERRRTADDPVARYRTSGRQLPMCVEKFAPNRSVRFAEMADWRGGILKAQNSLIPKMEKGNVEDRIDRVGNERILDGGARAGEIPLTLECTENVDMGM